MAGNTVLSHASARNEKPRGPMTAGVRSLTLTDFRNFRQARLVLDGRPVVLSGDNGAGKTNVLEAVSFLAPGRGLRRARLSAVTRLGAETGAWAVSAELIPGPAPELPLKIGTGLLAGEGERRQVRVDGAPQTSVAALARLLSVVWLTPEMDRLFGDAAQGRRQFFDRLTFGFDAGHAAQVNAYERALRERNRLLRDAADGADPAWLDALEAAMAAHGVAIAAARRETLARLDAALSCAGTAGAGNPQWGPFPRARLALTGLVEDWLGQSAAVDAEDRFRLLLAQMRGRDALAGRALDGPHRSDLVVWHDTAARPAAQCSTGQQKTLLIAIVLGYARALRHLGAMPVLLLDEVAAHLDQHARRALFDAIEALGAQAWLTGADSALFSAMGARAQYFTIAGGGVSET